MSAACGVRRAAWAALVLILAGCGPGRPVAPRADQPLGDDAARRLAGEVLAWHRAAEVLAADLLVRVKTEGRDALQFSINLWSPADGRVRIALSKVGVSGFEALIGADGALTATGRGGEFVKDDLEDAFAGDLGVGARLALLIDEFKRGPLPAVASYQAVGRSLSCVDPATGLRVTVQLAADSLQALSKSFANAQGAVVLRFDYARYKNLDGMQRPSLITVVVPERPGEYLMRVQQLDALPSIGDGRMALKEPGEAPAMDFAAFVRRLAE